MDLDSASVPTKPELNREAEDYLRALAVERNYSPSTIRTYRWSLEVYFSWCAEAGVDPLHPSRRQLRSYLGNLRASGLERTTINRHLSALKGYFGWMLVSERISDDPTSTLQGLKRNRSLPSKLSPEEMSRVLAVHNLDVASEPLTMTQARDLRDKALLELLYATGLRISEASRLSFSTIDIPHRQVRVLGKGSKERIVPLHDICAHSLARYISLGRPIIATENSPKDLVFLGNRGGSYSPDSIRKMFKNTLIKANVDPSYSPHDMRHTFASDLLEGGADLRSVQELLGHASLSTTQVYTHLSPSYLQSIHHQAHPRG